MIRNLFKKLSTAFPQSWQLGGQNWPITLRRRSGTKRITMRICGLTDTLRVSAPSSCSIKALCQVLETHTKMLEARVLELPPRQHFVDGLELPFLGGRLQVLHRPDSRTKWLDEGEGTDHNAEVLIVGGAPEHFQRRVRDVIQKRVRAELSTACAAAFSEASKSYNLRAIRRVTLTDTRGRWGSCAADGTLRFSWRLVFAPRWVFDYVVAHEVAHLAEMSHSPRFWAVVETMTHDARNARDWLQKNGSYLQRIGPIK